jgi:hypothetical protein
VRGVWPAAIITAVVLVVVGVPALIWGPGYLRYRQEIRVRDTGAPGIARVLRLEDTGNRFNDTPEIVIHLEVTAEGRPPWPARLTRILSVAELAGFSPGVQFPVRYDPARPERVAVAP